jgi:glycosyltransferase involved in cell wall biosynthesis
MVSIIVTTYNSERTVEETLQSITNQIFDKWECIIIDDGSSDSSNIISNNFVDIDCRFTLITNCTNTGQAAVSNQALEKATYQYIIFLDSDDILTPECLKDRFDIIDGSLDLWIFPNYALFDKIPGDLGDKEMFYNHNKPNYLKDFMLHNLPTPWNTTSVIWKKQSLKLIGNYNINYTRMVDVEIAVRALIYDLNYKVFCDKKVDFHYRRTLSNAENVKKRRSFYNSSYIFIEETNKFVRTYNPNKTNLVDNYLSKFYIGILAMVLISKDFDENDLDKILKLGHQKFKILKIPFKLKFIKSFSQKKIIRTIIWRTANLLKK